MKRWLALVFVLCMIGNLCACSGEKAVIVYDREGEVIATLGQAEFDDSDLSDVGYRSYVQLALAEAVRVIAQQEQCTEYAAQNKLFNKGYALYTAFDPAAHQAIHAMYAGYAAENLAVGCAILDYEGGVRAVYSGGDELYALTGHSVYSTMKPLSVYAPAIESGKIHWSTVLPDAPYKQVQNIGGQLENWPKNAGRDYTYEDTLLVDCLKNSLNTTAVHCLHDVGVENSIRFLQDSFGMDLSYEREKLMANGEDEVIGNIAMGYLHKGVSAVDLAGYYQIFGNGGQYIRPQALCRMQTAGGQTVYERTVEAKQVISEETAYIMNRLLSNVIMPGGTGAKAKVPGVEVVGKTGTGVEEGGNWFVGLTPEYSCAVWHGVGEETATAAAAMFAKIMENMPAHTVTEFPVNTSVHKDVYCSQSGKIFSFSSCSQMQVGYYALKNRPDICQGH